MIVLVRFLGGRHRFEDCDLAFHDRPLSLQSQTGLEILSRTLCCLAAVTVATETTVEQGFQNLTRVRTTRARNFLRCAGGYHPTTMFTTFWTKIDDVIGALDDV